FLLGGLYLGGDALQISFGLPLAVVNMLQGLIFFFVLGGDVLNGYQLAVKRQRPAPAASGPGR
ncbi:MAG TPA: ABC transporter permease, partial [bacterium]|nr:ABC transporter permease [bacterium]